VRDGGARHPPRRGCAGLPVAAVKAIVTTHGSQAPLGREPEAIPEMSPGVELPAADVNYSNASTSAGGAALGSHRGTTSGDGGEKGNWQPLRVHREAVAV